MRANKTHTHRATRKHARTHPSNQFSSPLSIHISIAAPHDVNKLGNPILYIFQRCQSVRMKCCLQALGKFLPSFLAECGSSFICLSMHKCGVGMKSFAARQLRCYFQQLSNHGVSTEQILTDLPERHGREFVPCKALLSGFLWNLFFFFFFLHSDGGKSSTEASSCNSKEGEDSSDQQV